MESGHKCAGYDYSTVFMDLFAILILRSYRWQVPSQDLSLDGSLIPPEIRSGLRLRLTGQRFDTVLVGLPDPAATAAELTRRLRPVG